LIGKGCSQRKPGSNNPKVRFGRMSGGHGPVNGREKEWEKRRMVRLEGNWRLSYFDGGCVVIGRSVRRVVIVDWGLYWGLREPERGVWWKEGIGSLAGLLGGPTGPVTGVKNRP
jgi:hypothetical protein